MSVIGGKKRRRKGTSDASGYSMSSSSMYRNEALKTLDERFDQVLLKEYNSDEEDDDEDSPISDDDDDNAPQLITTREDFTSMMDEFLNDYEILGGKMKPKLVGDTAAEKLETLRRAMGQDERVRQETGESDDEPADDVWVEKEDNEDRWDCETILNESDYSDSGSHIVHQTITRSKDETPEEKKARKAGVKAQQASRRAEKKANKSAFGNEVKAAKIRVSNQPAKGVRKL
ncbi:hypothetical protein MPER_12189 [Moniliophthora perniciosa FA553]|nr:hypothetical protein MPER_12189 [Moniliophthora perniciosa FA553]